MDKYAALLAINNNNNNNNGMLELLYHLAVVLNHSKSDFVRLFKALAINPQILQVGIFKELLIHYNKHNSLIVLFCRFFYEKFVRAG